MDRIASTSTNKKSSQLLLQHRVTTVLCLLSVAILQGLMMMTWRLDDLHNSNCNNDHLIQMMGDFKTGSTSKQRSHHSMENDFTLGRDWSQNANNFGGVQARSFESWPSDLPLPCSKPEKNWPLTEVQRSPAHEGFLMVKEMKTGSSTAVGMNLRIARNVAQRYFPQYKICKLRNDHANAERLDYKNRNRTKSFLYTIIRDPTKRAVSQFFHFQVSRLKIEPTDKNFIKWIGEERFIQNYYLRSLSMTSQSIYSKDYEPIAAANQILKDYDFIGVTERMDESAVAVQLLLGLTTGDILFLNAKSSGGFDDGASPRGCVFIVPGYVSPGMKEYFASPEWKRIALVDTMLHRAANRSLDLTIERLGKEKFQAALDKFQNAQIVLQEKCLPVVQYPCTSSGEPIAQPNCFWGDSGCGTACIDKVAEELNLYSAS